ncbi:MAG: Re/Si-specific NAD(P)(+) transhydrogenase subunit alpha [Bacteroidetes bacterium]|nr:Re/Si-specific NAD(P)(+) transhydrogenase subunit alpha [Bacteroidota bacterium]
MIIGVPKENKKIETRVPVLPTTVERLVRKGALVYVEAGLGETLSISDDEYSAAGATVVSDRRKLLKEADLVIRIRKPEKKDISSMKRGALHMSYLDPFFNHDLIGSLAEHGITAIAMEMIPRTTRAQKMDVLSSQASLAGYAAVIVAADSIQKIFPMMMTPAGTIQPAKVFVIGAGVAGLQAIATAKRLGAKVDAFDTRPVAKNDVLSLGAKFIEIDLGETGQTEQGYAKALTEEQLAKQRAEIKKYCAQADVVITTAQVFGKKAPIIVTKDMIEAMRPGSIVVDCAVETGGNVENVQPGKIIEVNGVKIVGLLNLPGRVAYNASQMYSNNIFNFIDEFWDDEKKTFVVHRDDDIIASCLLTIDGTIVHPLFAQKKEN